MILMIFLSPGIFKIVVGLGLVVYSAWQAA